MNARSRRPSTTTSCCRSGRKAGWCNERIHGTVAAVHDSAVRAPIAVADDRRAVPPAGRRGGEAETGAYGVSGSSAGGGGGRAGAERDHAKDSGGEVSESENAGRLSLSGGTAYSGGTDSQTGRGRLRQPERTGHLVGTGKTHLGTGLAVEACRQRKRVRFTTAAELVNELIEAKNRSEINRITNRWRRYELIVIDEMAYVAIP